MEDPLKPVEGSDRSGSPPMRVMRDGIEYVTVDALGAMQEIAYRFGVELRFEAVDQPAMQRPAAIER